MKNKFVLLCLVGTFFLVAHPNISRAEVNEHDHGMHHNDGSQSTTLKGKIIGVTCYLQHGSIGESHKNCAKDCATKGLPLGLLTEEGKLYQIMGKGHEELKVVNAKLMNYVEEENVTVVGQTFMKKGYHAIVIDKIKKQ